MGGGRDNVEKNQAKRTHARCGDKQKVRESGETEGRERGPRKSNERERERVGGGGGGGGRRDNGEESSKEDTCRGWR